MLDSTTLEVAIGLALLFFVLATAASAAVELGHKVTAKRARDLERAVVDLVTGAKPPPGGDATGLARLLNLGRARYVSAKAFADAALELVGSAKQSPAAAAALAPLMRRAEALARETRGNVTAVKAGLETWFDERMSDVQAEFQRRAALVLAGAGLVLVVLTNASAIHVAQDLWRDTTARQTVVAAAERSAAPGGESACAAADPVCEANRAYDTGLPLGWSGDQAPDGAEDWVWHLLGWAISALLVLLGAPFWFDVLQRLVGTRGGRVPPASEDPGSHTTLLRTAPAPGAELLGAPALGIGVPGQPGGQAGQAGQAGQGGEVDWLDVALNRA